MENQWKTLYKMVDLPASHVFNYRRVWFMELGPLVA
jgi:hypothetical protein